MVSLEAGGGCRGGGDVVVPKTPFEDVEKHGKGTAAAVHEGDEIVVDLIGGTDQPRERTAAPPPPPPPLLLPLLLSSAGAVAGFAAAAPVMVRLLLESRDTGTSRVSQHKSSKWLPWLPHPAEV